MKKMAFCSYYLSSIPTMFCDFVISLLDPCTNAQRHYCEIIRLSEFPNFYEVILNALEKYRVQFYRNENETQKY